MNEDTRRVRETVLESDEWNLLEWRECGCGSVAFQFAYRIEEEGTYQAKVTTFFRCLRCGKVWSEWERDWN